MKLIKYIDMCGKFDHDLYRSDQENGKKIDKIWASEDVVRKLGAFLKSNIKSLHFGLCHGTRRGKNGNGFRNILMQIPLVWKLVKLQYNFPHSTMGFS